MLHAYPNHHRALSAISRLAEKERTIQPRGAAYTVECYFDRAMRLAPDDHVVRMLFASYLGKRNRVDDAARLLESVTQLGSDSGFTQYNVGLIYIELKQYERALAQAHRAAALGFGRLELRQALERVGKWQDPPPAPAPTPASAPEAASSRPNTTGASAPGPSN